MVGATMNEELVCLQRLKRKAEKFNGEDPVPAEDARRLVVDLIFCFTQFAIRTDKEIARMRKVSQERSSWKWWFIDRVLPTLVTWAILGALAWIALVNQHVIVIPSKDITYHISSLKEIIMPQLDPVVVWLIGIVSVAFVGIVKFIAARSGKKLPTIALQWIAFVIAGAIALTQGFPVIPPLDLGGDPSQSVAALFQWLSDLLVAVGPFFTYTTLIYTTLWKAIGDKVVRKVVARFRKPSG